MDNTFLSVLTGTDCWGANEVKKAIAKRAAELIPKIEKRAGLEHPDWTKRHCYDGNRCEPENLGWRFENRIGSPEPQEILDGKWDEQIEAIYHDAASAEYWYAFEKDWGEF